MGRFRVQDLALPLHRRYSQRTPALPLPWANPHRKINMKILILSSLNRLHKDEAGQGLVEYLLILALVAFAATAGMNTLASGLNSAFSKVGNILGQYIS